MGTRMKQLCYGDVPLMMILIFTCRDCNERVKIETQILDRNPKYYTLKFVGDLYRMQLRGHVCFKDVPLMMIYLHLQELQ